MAIQNMFIPDFPEKASDYYVDEQALIERRNNPPKPGWLATHLDPVERRRAELGVGTANLRHAEIFDWPQPTDTIPSRGNVARAFLKHVVPALLKRG
jgi:hypothetical protein